eukprot:1844271-Amphidinium_carterae.1
MVEVIKVSSLATRPPFLQPTYSSQSDAVVSIYFSYVPMAAASQYSTFASTFGTTPNWPTFIQGMILAVCNEVGGEPHMFDVVEYLNPELEEQCRLDLNQSSSELLSDVEGSRPGDDGMS